MLIYYTEKEAGKWYPLNVSFAKDELLKILKNPKNWGELIKGDKSSRVTIISDTKKGDYQVKARSIKFQNGEIWDSVLRSFRKEKAPIVPITANLSALHLNALFFMGRGYIMKHWPGALDHKVRLVPEGDYLDVHKSTFKTLLERGLIKKVSEDALGEKYKLTDAGEKYLAERGVF